MKTTLMTIALLSATSSAHAGDWEIDASHSSAGFAVKHMMVSTVRGQFEKMSGTVKIDDQDPTKSIIDVTIDAASIDTRDAKRDEHLKSPDFFDVAKHPKITFKSKKIVKGANGKLLATGDLTMRGVTKPVTLQVEPLSQALKNPWGQTVRGVSATATLNRKDWGLAWNKALETGGVLVGEEVQLQIDAELVAKTPATTARK
jgi:polyisoprenoid-binding protein YceI